MVSPFLFRRFSSRSTTRATRKVLPVLLHPAQQMRLSNSTHPGFTPRATSSFYNSYAGLAQPPLPPPSPIDPLL